jgi:tetratricopeptide (TPR) repeat protein
MKVRELSRKLRTNLTGNPGEMNTFRAHFRRGENSSKAALLKPIAKPFFFAAVLAAAVVAPARAAYDDLGTSARVSGMSNAYTAVADDVYAIYYNPAGLALVDRPEVATTYSMIVTGLSDGSNVQNSFIGYAQPIKGGEYGTAGIGWNYFSLDSLYRESSVFLSYGNRLTPQDSDLPIYGGITTKYLYRSINPGALAGNSISNTGQILTGVSDPLLQNGAKSNLDFDLGLLWQVLPHWDAGFQVQHLFAPNIAFTPGQTDTLQRNLKFGGAYRSPFSTIDADFDIIAAPDGTMERDVNLGVEKWLPTLLYGAFGLRAGLGYGTDDYRQLTIGLSYRIHRLQVDYGFVMPLGSFSSTSGTQRIGLSWRFGETPQAERIMGDMLLENLTESAPPGTPEFNKQAAQLVDYKRRAIDLLMHTADDDATEGRFAAAHARVQEAQSLAPQDKVIAEVAERYRTASLYFPDISDALSDKTAGNAATAAAATRDGLLDFIAGKNREALASIVNARTLQPTASHDAMIRILQARLGEPMLGVTAAPAVAAAPPVHASSGVDEGPNASKRILDSTVALMELAFFQQEWDKVADLAGQVINLDPKNVLAYKRLAAAEHVRKHYAAALKALQEAYALEADPSERARLKGYIDALKAQIARASKPAAVKPVPANGGPEDVERMYEAGVELYAQGRLGEAMEAFRRCLQIDAGYVPAQRAYERVQSEQMQSGKSQ